MEVTLSAAFPVAQWNTECDRRELSWVTGCLIEQNEKQSHRGGNRGKECIRKGITTRKQGRKKGRKEGNKKESKKDRRKREEQIIRTSISGKEKTGRKRRSK